MMFRRREQEDVRGFCGKQKALAETNLFLGSFAASQSAWKFPTKSSPQLVFHDLTKNYKSVSHFNIHQLSKLGGQGC